jgi:purine-binding chemotaxis protein CheW
MNATARNLRLVVRSGSHTCALDLSAVVETMRPLPIKALRSAPEAVLGLSIVRGTPVPVVDLARLLKEIAPAPCTRFISVRVAERACVLAVSSVVGILDIPASRLAAMPPLLQAVCPEVIDAISSLDSALLLVLKSAGLVPPDEGFAPEEG